MRAYNFHFAVALRVIIDQEAYPGMFDGPRGALVKGLTGTIIAIGPSVPHTQHYGCAQIQLDAQWNDRIKQLGWMDSTPWFLSGALSLHPDAIEETRQYCLKGIRTERRKIREAHAATKARAAQGLGQSNDYWESYIASCEKEIEDFQQAWQGVTRLPALPEQPNPGNSTESEAKDKGESEVRNGQW